MVNRPSDEYCELIWKLSWCRQRAVDLGLDSGAQLIRLAIDQIREPGAPQPTRKRDVGTPEESAA